MFLVLIVLRVLAGMALGALVGAAGFGWVHVALAVFVVAVLSVPRPEDAP